MALRRRKYYPRVSRALRGLHGAAGAVNQPASADCFRVVERRSAWDDPGYAAPRWYCRGEQPRCSVQNRTSCIGQVARRSRSENGAPTSWIRTSTRLSRSRIESGSLRVRRRTTALRSAIRQADRNRVPTFEDPPDVCRGFADRKRYCTFTVTAVAEHVIAAEWSETGHEDELTRTPKTRKVGSFA